VIAPDLPFQPDAAISRLRELTRRHAVDALIGSSLGGFYATALNAAQPLPTVLINPVVAPHELLAAHLGPQHRWCDGAAFQVDDDYLAALRGLHRDALAADEAYLVLLQQGDEVLDYRRAAAYYRDRDVLEIPGGSHRFDHLEHYLPQIGDWLAAQGCRTAACAPPR
jgi:predicted esterase YcpF (UPF0227 family)